VESFRQLMRSAAATERESLPGELRQIGGDPESDEIKKNREK